MDRSVEVVKMDLTRLILKKHALSSCKFVKVWNLSTTNPHLQLTTLFVKRDKILPLRLVLNTKDSGTKRVRKMAEVFKSGLMDHCTKVTGKMIKLTVVAV